MRKIALKRPGALGDIIMSFNFIKKLKENHEVYYFCHSNSFNILNNFVVKNNLDV